MHTNVYDYAVPPEARNENYAEHRKIFPTIKFETAHPSSGCTR